MCVCVLESGLSGAVIYLVSRTRSMKLIHPFIEFFCPFYHFYVHCIHYFSYCNLATFNRQHRLKKSILGEKSILAESTKRTHHLVLGLHGLHARLRQYSGRHKRFDSSVNFFCMLNNLKNETVHEPIDIVPNI